MIQQSAVLTAGLGAIFLSVVAGVSAMVLVGQKRKQVVRSLEAVTFAHYGHGPVAPPERSFSDRVLLPGLARLAGLGRRLSPGGAATKLSRRLDLAGNPAGYDVERVLALKALGLLVAGLLALLLVPGGLKVIGVPAAAAFGFFLPDILLSNVGLKRQEAIQRELPDALDLLTISVEAGLGFDAALSQVARNTNGPLSGEFFRVLQEMHIGKSRAAAFRGMSERTDVDELSRFTAAIVQADGLGIPIGHVLREQAAEMRLKRSQRAEEKAHKVPVKILFPMVIFLLPAIFVIIMGPGAITIMQTI